MRIFGSDRIAGLMQRLGMEEGVPIEHGMVTKAIERAQTQVEAQNFSVRKHLLEYDDVMNKQRESVYALRRELLEGKIHVAEDEVVDTRQYLITLAEELSDAAIESACGKDVDVEDWDLEGLKRTVGETFALDPAHLAAIDLEDKNVDEIRDALWTSIERTYVDKEQSIDATILRRVERDIMLQIVDVQWKDHLYSLDHLKEGIGLRGYGQRDPLVEYKRESFGMFQAMKERIDQEMVRYLWRLRPAARPEPAAAAAARPAAPIQLNHPGEAVPAFAGAAMAVGAGPRPGRTGGDDARVRTVRRDEPKVGRNDPCPCGSGRKYKNCHGA
jgi:preprotein translocase subunit SecA